MADLRLLRNDGAVGGARGTNIEYAYGEVRHGRTFGFGIEVEIGASPLGDRLRSPSTVVRTVLAPQGLETMTGAGRC